MTWISNKRQGEGAAPGVQHRGDREVSSKIRNVLSGIYGSPPRLTDAEIGASLLGFGLLLTFLGMMLFFEGNLLRLGNVRKLSFANCFYVSLCSYALLAVYRCSSVRIVFGNSLRSRVDFRLLSSQLVVSYELKDKPSTEQFIGILLVFWGKPRVGILCEIFGLLNLFGNMFPVLLALARRLPVISSIIDAFEGSGKQQRAPAGVHPRRRVKRYNPEF